MVDHSTRTVTSPSINSLSSKSTSFAVWPLSALSIRTALNVAKLKNSRRHAYRRRFVARAMRQCKGARPSQLTRVLMERGLVLHAAGRVGARTVQAGIKACHFGDEELGRHVVERPAQHLVFHEGAARVVVGLQQGIACAIEVEWRDAETRAER